MMRKLIDDGRGSQGYGAPAGDGRAQSGIDDESIRADVNERVALTPRIAPERIAVSVIDGEVLLEGRIPSQHLRSVLLDGIARCRGVQRIRDRLIVDELPAAQARARTLPGTLRADLPDLSTRAERATNAPDTIPATPGPSLWWIAAAIVAVVTAFWVVYVFV